MSNSSFMGLLNSDIYITYYLRVLLLIFVAAIFPLQVSGFFKIISNYSVSQ